MGVLESPGKVLDFFVTKRVGTLCIVSKRINIPSDFFLGFVAPPLRFSITTFVKF